MREDREDFDFNNFESFERSQVEKKFRCPYCHEKISMVMDVSEIGRHLYVEDCEVCCRPIEISYAADRGRLFDFTARSI